MNCTPDELTSRLELAIAIAREAGELTLNYFQHDELQIDRKSDDSPVTVADREAEALLRERISERFADDAILGEELGQREGTSPYRWVLDPIDGTKSFISGVPLYSTLVAVLEGEKSVAGVIRIPALGEMVYAAQGQGAWYVQGESPPRRCQVSPTGSLAESLYVTTEIESFRQQGRLDAHHRLDQAARLGRTWGDGYGYLMVATGRAEVMVDPLMNLWDAATMQPILEEAGGTFTDWKGNATIHGGEGIATNGHILEEVLATLG